MYQHIRNVSSFTVKITTVALLCSISSACVSIADISWSQNTSLLGFSYVDLNDLTHFDWNTKGVPYKEASGSFKGSTDCKKSSHIARLSAMHKFGVIFVIQSENSEHDTSTPSSALTWMTLSWWFVEVEQKHLSQRWTSVVNLWNFFAMEYFVLWSKNAIVCCLPKVQNKTGYRKVGKSNLFLDFRRTWLPCFSR